MQNVFRLDFHGISKTFRRTPQGFLRVKARLSKSGVFDYGNSREYRPDQEVFSVDSLESLKGAPVTDLHPSESGGEAFLNSANAKTHMVGITESVDRDGPYLKGSLIIFHEDTIKSIESGARKEISLGYQCLLDPTPGIFKGQAYDAVQKNIQINHVALGPKGWGRAGPDCAIRNDSRTIQPQGLNMSETVRLDGVDVSLSPENITNLFMEKQKLIAELEGRLDAMGLELQKVLAAKAELEDPRVLEEKIQARLKLVDQCRSILGQEIRIDSKSNEDLKLEVIKQFYPGLDVAHKDQGYLDGMFETIHFIKTTRNDSLLSTRQAIQTESSPNSNQAYEKWLEHSAKLWTLPLGGKN